MRAHAVLILQVLQLYRTRLWSWLEWPAIRYRAISYPCTYMPRMGASVGRRLPGNSDHSTWLDSGYDRSRERILLLIERPFLRLKYAVPGCARRRVPASHPQPATRTVHNFTVTLMGAFAWPPLRQAESSGQCLGLGTTRRSGKDKARKDRPSPRNGKVDTDCRSRIANLRSELRSRSGPIPTER